MIYLILTLVLILLVYCPTLWVKYTLNKYSKHLSELPGTGAELARHLIERFQLNVDLEHADEGGDHYDPGSHTVRLSPSYFTGKSLTAVAVAAHEVGHAIQFARQEPISKLRSRYIPLAILMKKLGIYLLMSLPVIGFLPVPPVLMGVLIGLSLLLQLAGASMYLIVLPEEWDASFNKALPILAADNYLSPDQLASVRKVLKAAALTYFAGALADLVNIGRWWMILRR